MKHKVVYTDPMWLLGEDGCPDLSKAALEREIFGDAIDLQVGPHANGKYLTNGPELLQAVSGADAMVIYRTSMTGELLSAAGTGCKVVARQGVGFDNLNVPLLKERAVYGFNVPDYCVDEVSTHAMALLLSLERQVCFQDAGIRAGQWGIFNGGYPRRLNDCILGIVGLGRIGAASARKGQAFFRKVIAYDPAVRMDHMRGLGVEWCASLPALMAEADAVLLHPTLNETSRNLINPHSLSNSKPGQTIVNTARGQIVDVAAILDSLRSGRLGGFASDVFSPEDPNQDPINAQLLSFENVVVSSHRAFLSTQSEASQRRRVAEGVKRVLLSGSPPDFGRLA